MLTENEEEQKRKKHVLHERHPCLFDFIHSIVYNSLHQVTCPDFVLLLCYLLVSCRKEELREKKRDWDKISHNEQEMECSEMMHKCQQKSDLTCVPNMRGQWAKSPCIVVFFHPDVVPRVQRMSLDKKKTDLNKKDNFTVVCIVKIDDACMIIILKADLGTGWRNFVP